MKKFLREYLLTTLIILGSLLLNYLDKPNWAVGILIVTVILLHFGMNYFMECYVGAIGKPTATYSELTYHKIKGKNLLR